MKVLSKEVARIPPSPQYRATLKKLKTPCLVPQLLPPISPILFLPAPFCSKARIIGIYNTLSASSLAISCYYSSRIRKDSILSYINLTHSASSQLRRRMREQKRESRRKGVFSAPSSASLETVIASSGSLPTNRCVRR